MHKSTGDNILDKARCVSVLGMFNPFESFIPFISALLDHLITLLAGCAVTVMIGIIEKRILKRPISVKLEVGILLGFVFFACFQAWRDQYRVAQQSPSLQAQVKDDEKIIQNLRANPPHVEVNLPTPVVNIPPQMAYMARTNAGIVVSSYKMGGNLAVSSDCKNLSTIAIAQKTSCVIGLRIVDTKLNPIKEPVVYAAVEEEEWSKFMKDPAIGAEQKDYGPTQGDFKSVWTRTIDRELDEAFTTGTKTLLLLGEYKWTDGLGEHTNEDCVWLQNYPGLFNHGTMNPNPTITWHSCEKHHGLKK